MAWLEMISTMIMVKTVGATVKTASTQKLLNHLRRTLSLLASVQDTNCLIPLGELLDKIDSELVVRGIQDSPQVDNSEVPEIEDYLEPHK